MYFDRPVYLWLLVLLPLLWFFLSRYVSTGDRVRKMWAKPSLSALLTPHRRDFLAALLVVVGFISLAVALADAGVLDKYNVRLLGTPLDTIRRCEDRKLFRDFLREVGEPEPRGEIASTI